MKVEIVDEQEFIKYIVGGGQAASFMVSAVRHEDKITISLTSDMPIKRGFYAKPKEETNGKHRIPK